MNSNPFAKEGWNLTRQMALFRRCPEEAHRLQAEAKSDNQSAPSVVPTVEVIARVLALEVRRNAGSGGSHEGNLQAMSRAMGADDETYRAAMQTLAQAAGRRSNGKWLPHHYNGEAT